MADEELCNGIVNEEIMKRGGARSRAPATGSLENEQVPQSHLEKRFTTQDMLEAFRHGREFDQLECDGDMICDATPTKNLPFYEWIARFQENATDQGRGPREGSYG